MSQLVYGIVRESQRRVIHVVRVQDKILGPYELDDIAERMREKLASRGELTAEVVVVQGASKRRFACRAILIQYRGYAPRCSMRL